MITPAPKQITDTLDYLIGGILPPEVEYQIITSQQPELLTLEVALPPEYTGYLIGKNGSVIKALRTLLNLAYPSLRFLLQIKS